MDNLLDICQNPIFISSCLKDWDKFGKKNFLIKCKEGGSEGSTRLLLDVFIKLIDGEGKVDILSKLLSELMKTHVNAALMMERLSEDTLENTSLIQSRQQFQTRYVRTKTRLFFKQQKFNLLREENEGYAKLITELSQATGPMDDVMTQIRSLIGYFDLDPNRVLDLILNACEIRENMSCQLIHLLRLYNPDKLDLTHVLGHKFQFTQEPGAATPSSLFRIAALLITSGLINMEALYSHLTPSDVEVQGARTRLISSAKAYRPSAQLHAALAQSAAINTSLNNVIANDLVRTDNTPSSNLIMTSLLPDHAPTSNGWMSNGPLGGNKDNGTGDTMPTPQVGSLPEAAEFDPVSDPLYENNQKLELCATLIQMGDWSNAQLILDRFQGYWTTGHPQVCKALCELLHSLIEPLYAKECPLPGCLQRPRRRPAPFPSSRLVGIDVEMTEAAGSSEPLAPANSWAKLARTVLPMAAYLGPNMSSDVVLMAKFCRLGYAYMQDQSSSTGSIGAVYQGFFNLLDEVLLPSLSLVDMNCCLSEEIWQFLRLFPFEHRSVYLEPHSAQRKLNVVDYYTRKHLVAAGTMDQQIRKRMLAYYYHYRLYGQWKNSSSLDEPICIRKKADLVSRTKAIMKRLSKENIKPMGRQLGKLSHSNPGLLFEHVLSSIQLYSNLVSPVVEALKYISNLGYDMCAFCIIEALAADEAKLEEVQLSQSLQALSAFTGLLCKKYQFDLCGMLQYVLNQLKVGKSYDLLVLREILNRMSGIDTSEDMTDEQLESMSGGELLLQEGGYYAQIRNTRKTATRLKEALIGHNLVMPFLILMAQQRDAVLFLDDPDRHVKLVGRLYDTCQGTLVQFITFLSLQLTREEMQTQCLPIEKMMGEFHVPVDTAFCLHRSLFEQKVASLLEVKGRTELVKSGEHSKSTSRALFVAASQQICSELAAAVRPLYPVRVWDELGAGFFVTFWSLQSSDLVLPEAAYQRQSLQLRDQMRQMELSLNGWTVAKKKREIERLQGLVDKLDAEQVERQGHVARVRTWLLTERDNWFQLRSATKMDTIIQFLQLCIYPRVCYTAIDAVYAAQFLHVLHQLKTSRFSTLICLDRIFNDITLPTSMCTEDEAHRYGRFLCAVLELVMRWHASEEVFNQECGQYPGFVTVFRKGSDSNTEAAQLQYENYRHVVHKWHYRITKATVACLESGSYVQIRNALIVLIRILPQYPRILQLGSAVERRVIKLKEEEKDRRPDLKALAFSYAGLLLPRKAKWVNEEDFHVKENPPRTETVSGLNRSTGASPKRSLAITDRAAHGTRSAATHSSHITAPSADIVYTTNQEGSISSTGVRRSQGTSGAVPISKSTTVDTRTHSHAVNPSNSSNVVVGSGETMTRNSSAVAQQGSLSGGQSTRGHSPTSKARSNQRFEQDVVSYHSEITDMALDSSQGLKRRRVETVAPNSTAANSMSPPSSTSAQKTISGVDELKEIRRPSRKRSNPVVTQISTAPTTPSDGNDDGRHSNSANRPSTGNGSFPLVEPPSNSTQSMTQVTSSRHSSKLRQRASSSNSTDSRDEEERSSSASSKKSKRAHHHHHRRRSAERAGISPSQATVYSSSSSTATSGTVVVTADRGSALSSGSSRHSRK